MDEDWRPGIGNQTLRLRAAMLARAREFFAARALLEVETPVIGVATVSDLHIDSLATRLAGREPDFYLQTSPEYHMKRLLAAGSGDIYQVCRVFRDGEAGRRHNPEFTMIEWYRLAMPYLDLAGEVCELLAVLLDEPALAEAEFVEYAAAFERCAGLGADDPAEQKLLAALKEQGLAIPRQASVAALQDLVFSTLVAPRLGHEKPTVIYRYPAEQAALARLCPDDTSKAERFEVFCRGMELANGFHELTDAVEQRQRFSTDLDQRGRAERPAVAIDERLIAALASGLPACSGVALGFDRVVMLAAGSNDIAEAMAFDIARA
ncbi:MAG: EF-P lysine aminoacylase EpmA [Gammaproteobacteria bacterium]|nr:EF-P lysine aminoacylase EpmA [Gammaproteobacteria bacterium]